MVRSLSNDLKNKVEFMKNKFKKVIKIVVIVMVALILLPFVAFGIQLLTVPISRSDEGVYSYVYKKIPVGTSWDEVLEIIDDKGWEIKELHTEYGLCIYNEATTFFATDDELASREKSPSKSRVVGVKSMFVELGEFYCLFHTAVFIYIAFDEDDKLIEIVIRRDVDSF